MIGFAASVALALVLTNLDNLALLIAIAVPVGLRRALAGYVLAQGLVLGLSLGLAAGVAEVFAARAGVLGLVPLGLGAWALWRGGPGAGPEPEQRPGQRATLLATVGLFLGLSMDSFAVLTALLADSAPLFRGAALLGGVAGIALMAGAGAALARVAERSARWLGRADRFAPYVMMAAGLYVLWNSGTDMW